MRTEKWLLALLLPVIAVAQNDTRNIPPAVKAPGEPLPKLCSAEPMETPLSRWIDGTARVELLVGSDGRVHETRILESSYSEEDKAVIGSAIQDWRFRPTYFHGYFVNAKVIVEIEISKYDLRIRLPKGGCIDAPFTRM